MLNKYLKEHAKTISYCTYCPKMCRFACPVGVADASETSIVQGRMTLLHLALGGAIDFDEQVASMAYKCCTCLHCNTYCRHDFNIPDVMYDARRAAYELGVEPKIITERMLNFEHFNNPYPLDLRDELEGLVEERFFAKGASAVYFPGCNTILRQQKNLLNTLEIFDELGIDFVSVWQDKQQCCLAPMITAGRTSEFIALARGIASAMRDYRLIIFACPLCYYAFRVLYPRYGFNIGRKMLHISEFLLDRLKGSKRKLKPGDYGKIAYHDPCYLGRYMGIYDAPRELLVLCVGDAFSELYRVRQDSICCGANGWLPAVYPQTSRRILDLKLAEYREMEYDALVTACPTCETHFNKRAKDIEVLDLVNILRNTLYR